MDKWVYLQGDNLADALALVSVLRNNEEFHIVRRSCFSPIFSTKCNYGLKPFCHSESAELINIKPIESDSWKDKCDDIASQLGVKLSSYEVSLNFEKEANALLDYCKDPFGLLYLFPSSDQPIELIEIDKLVRELESLGIKFISGGTNLIPCIKRTKDLRQLFTAATICQLRKIISFIITSEKYMLTIGEAIGLKVFYISQTNLQLSVNNEPVSDYLQIANYIKAQL